MKKLRCGESPAYWWEYGKDNTIVVESNVHEYPLAIFDYVGESAEKAIVMAENKIDKLNRGQIL